VHICAHNSTFRCCHSIAFAMCYSTHRWQGGLFSLEFARVARTLLSLGLVCVGARALARPFAPLCSETERDNAAQWTEARGTRKLRRNN